MIGAPRPVEPRKFAGVAEFFAQALAIEVEAAERYTLLADQMDVHDNQHIAAIFSKNGGDRGRTSQRRRPPRRRRAPLHWPILIQPGAVLATVKDATRRASAVAFGHP